MPNWTKEQEQAIYQKGSNTLVAAAAGSGKTAVLVERMIHKIIDEKIDIDKILVVTFTNAAAAEMRERILDAIYEKLEQNPDDEHLQKQVTLLNLANICTIDSFCLEVVKNNFYELENMSPNFRIADTTEIELLKEEEEEEEEEPKKEFQKDEKRCIEEEVSNIFNQVDSSETYKSYTIYIVRENDSIESIIEKYGVSKEQLEIYNDLSEIKLGDKIIIPS